MDDVLQPGHRQVAAGYVHLRVEHDAGVHHGAGGARLHARPDHRRVPALAPEHRDAGRSASTTASTRATSRAGTGAARWRCAASTATRRSGSRGRTAATSASLVADFHRNLIDGGIFLYPGRHEEPERQAAAALRVQPDGVHRRAGGRRGHRRHRAASSTCSPSRCTSARRWSSARKADVEFVDADDAGVRGRRDMTRRDRRSRSTAPATGTGEPGAGSRCARAGSRSRAGSVPHDVHRAALDDAPVRRLRHRRGDQHPLSPPARGRPDRGSRRRSTCRRRWAYDSDHPLAEGEVGRVGVAIDTVDDLRAAVPAASRSTRCPPR